MMDWFLTDWLHMTIVSAFWTLFGFTAGLFYALHHLESIIRKTRMEEQNEAMGNPYRQVPFQ